MSSLMLLDSEIDWLFRSPSYLSSTSHRVNTGPQGADKPGQPGSSPVARKRPTPSSSAPSPPRGPATVPVPGGPGRSFTVGNAPSFCPNTKRNKDSNVSTGGTGSVWALGSNRLCEPGPAEHPGMKVQHQVPPSSQQPRANSMKSWLSCSNFCCEGCYRC